MYYEAIELIKLLIKAIYTLTWLAIFYDYVIHRMLKMLIRYLLSVLTVRMVVSLC